MLKLLRENEIHALAESIADFYFPSSLIIPELIAIDNGISYDYDSYESYFDGMIQFASGEFHIFLNLDKLRAQDTPRSRFTFAHELGHFYIDEHRNALKSGRVKPHSSMVEIYSNNNLAEMEADCFASGLLMPRKRFIEIAKRKKTEYLSVILQLAETFKVSVLSAAVNFIKLNLSQSVLIKWGSSGFEWSIPSESFKSSLAKKLFIDFSPARGTATFLAQNQPEKYSLQFHSSTSTLSTWSKSIFPTNKENYILKEEAIKLGNYGGLTLLTVIK